MGRSCRHDPVPYYADLDTRLLSFGGEYLRIRDFCEAFAIFGAPGSGKTSTSAFYILCACLLAGMGGLFLCAKADAVDEIRRAAIATGRLHDLVFIDASDKSERINILDYASRHLGGEGFEQNLIDLMGRMVEATRQANSTGGSDTENRYFTDGALKLFSHVFPLLLAAYGTLRMRDVNQLIASAPQSLAEARSEAWKSSFCYQTLARIAVLARKAAATGKPDMRLERVILEHGDFLVDEFCQLDSRPRSGIISTATNMIYPFLTGKLADLFCTTTTITPQAARMGKIIVMDLPAAVYGAGGIVAQTLFKYLFGLAMQSEKVDKNTRCVFIMVDEAQAFMNSYSADLLATARSSRICVTYVTQDLPTYYAKLGANSRDVAESILSKFGTRFFHANSSRETNQAASDLIGRVQKFHLSETRSRGNAVGAGDNQHDRSGGFHGSQGANVSTGQSTSGYLDYEIPPDFFATRLRTGSKANRYKADAIVVRTARTWKGSRRHWILAEFSQR